MTARASLTDADLAHALSVLAGVLGGTSDAAQARGPGREGQ